MADDLPQGIALTALDEDFRTDPYPILKKIREQAPVLEDRALNRFFYTRHEDVRSLLRDKELWTDPRRANEGSFSKTFLGNDPDEQPSMLMMDEPDHRRLRSLVSKPFMPAEVEKWRVRTREVIARVLEDIEDGEFDLIRDFAGPIPTIVIAEMLGIREEMHTTFKEWSDKSVLGAFSPFSSDEESEQRQQASQNLADFFRQEISARRNNLGNDVLSDMIRAEEAGDRLTEDEIVTQCNLLLVAGNVTTTDLIGNGVKALLDHPDQLTSLVAEPALINNAIEEVLRYDSPVTNSGRITNRELTMSGCPVAKGESLSTSLAAANRDPAVYPDPDKFDIKRANTSHQSFGGGRHTCLGAHLARLEAQEAILALVERFKNLAHSDRGYEYAANPSFRGMNYFWIKASS